MKVTITRSCVGDGGATLEEGSTVEQSPNTARLLIGNGQAVAVADAAPEPAPEPEPAPAPAPKKKKPGRPRKMDLAD